MGIPEIFLCILVGHCVVAQPVIKQQDDVLFQNFPGFFDKLMSFPFERNFDVTPYDTIFSSWRTWAPDFHMLADMAPTMNIPRIQVFCDESQLTVLIDKRSYGVLLTAEEIQLGHGCYSNREEPNQLVFTYSVNECGTARVVS